MADSVDRVFVHALNTVKKIPKTGASRPPPPDRLRLYGLYKQAMEGDVDGVMERPGSGAASPGGRGGGGGPQMGGGDELQRERDKWDAWNVQKGLSRVEAKRRYIEALIDTMHRYATTPDARELVDELEFVWNQIKNNGAGSASSSPKGLAAKSSAGGGAPASPPRKFQQPLSGTDGPMKVLSPMSEEDEAERDLRLLGGGDGAAAEQEEGEDIEGEDDEYSAGGSARSPVDKRRSRRGSAAAGGGGGGGSEAWTRRMERAVVKLTAEVAALREQITRGREWRARRERSWPSWLGWAAWVVARHAAADVVLLGLVLLWMRRRKDRRLEDLVRRALGLAREYARMVLPSR